MPLRVLNRIYREKEPKEEKVRKEIATLRDSLHESPLKRKLSKWVETLDTEPAKARAKGVPQETLGGPLDAYFAPGEPEKPKEPAPLTHLKVGDIVHIEVGNWQELGDYAKVIAVDGEQITVEGIEPKHQGRKVFNERHFLTFSMGWGDHPGDSKKYPGSYYFFHFAMIPPDDVLALGLRKYEEATGSDEYRKYYNLFNYFAPEAEFKPKAKELDEALLRHHFYSPHGVNIEELFHGVKPLPRKAWELEPVYVQDFVGIRTVVSEDLERRPRFHDEWSVRYDPIEKGLRPTIFTYPTKEMAEAGKKFHDEDGDGKRWQKYGIIERLSQKGQAAVGIARELEPPRFCKDEVLSMLKDNERKPWTNTEYNQGWFEALEQAYVRFGGQAKFEGYAKEMDLRLSPGRFKKGEWVYTCTKCGREGEQEWMKEHLKSAHKVGDARTMESILRVLPKRREYANVR